MIRVLPFQWGTSVSQGAVAISPNWVHPFFARNRWVDPFEVKPPKVEPGHTDEEG